MRANLDSRPDPDALLAQIKREDSQLQSGRLSIFLGMSPGVGKTYAMLQAAHQRMAEGVQVMVGVVETHGRVETQRLTEGMHFIPRVRIEHRDVELAEFDVDGALRLRPQLLLVDELAHTNVPGSRHAKRYQDVLELLDAGIDVYTTLNVQHIESQVDIVRQVSGVVVHETVPDSVLDRAYEIQLIDLSVEKLLERLAEGKVYLGDRAQAAAEGFFKEGNLTALRELALRFTAERVDRDMEDIRRARRVISPWKTNARLLVGVAPSPYAESLIRWTRRAAARLGCPWLVVWVEGAASLPPQDQERLTHALGLARKLGGEVMSVTGEDVAHALLRVARERNVSQIVVGKPERRGLFRTSLADCIIAHSGDIDVCVVRPTASERAPASRPAIPTPAAAAIVAEYSWACVITFALGSICWALAPVTGYTFVALVFLLSVVLAALWLGRGPVILMAALSAVVWNFFFIPPLFTFLIRKPEDVTMFAMFFVVALSMGSLTARLRVREQAERRRLRLTSALLRVTQSAALAADLDKGLAEALRTINELLGAESALVVRKADHTLPDQAHSASTFTPSAKEWGVIAWTFHNKQAAGRFTDTLPESHAIWFPVQTATSIMGVLGITLPRGAVLDFVARQTVEACALQIALVLEKEHFVEAASQAEIVARSEELHRMLLDSLSHELKTPLAVIHAALEAMATVSDPYLDELRTASARLQRVVTHFLRMSQVESDVLRAKNDWCDIRDVIHSAEEAAGPAFKEHEIIETVPDSLPLLRLDAALLTQALANILHNAGIYSPAVQPIEVAAAYGEGKLRITVRDHGPGLPVGEEGRVFEKFYRAPGAPAGGTGLGLAIARGLLRALRGDILARNHPQGGAVFEIVLLAERMSTECSAPAVEQPGS